MQYESTTGLDHTEIQELVARIQQIRPDAGRVRRPLLGLYQRVVFTLVLVRQQASLMAGPNNKTSVHLSVAAVTGQQLFFGDMLRSQRLKRRPVAVSPADRARRLALVAEAAPSPPWTQQLRFDPPRECWRASSLDPPRDPLFDALTTGVIALGLHYATYAAEVYRAGIEAVPVGQWEAATALSLPRSRTWRAVILPQAIPRVLPALGTTTPSPCSRRPRCC